MRVANREKKIWVHRSLVWKNRLGSFGFVYLQPHQTTFGLHLFQQLCQKNLKNQDCSQIETYIHVCSDKTFIVMALFETVPHLVCVVNSSIVIQLKHTISPCF